MRQPFPLRAYAEVWGEVIGRAEANVAIGAGIAVRERDTLADGDRLLAGVREPQLAEELEVPAHGQDSQSGDAIALELSGRSEAAARDPDLAPIGVERLGGEIAIDAVAAVEFPRAVPLITGRAGRTIAVRFHFCDRAADMPAPQLGLLRPCRRRGERERHCDRADWLPGIHSIPFHSCIVSASSAA